MLITVYFNRPSNPYHSRPMCAVRNIASRTFKTETEARGFVEEVHAHGLEVISIYNNIGRKITL